MFGFLTISHTICTCQWFPLKGKEENKLSVQILKATKIHGIGCKILKLSQKDSLTGSPLYIKTVPNGSSHWCVKQNLTEIN